MTKTNSSKSKTGKQSTSKSAAVKPAKPSVVRNQKVHIREKADKTSDTLCGGSHSSIWGMRDGYELKSVGPQQAAKATCGRCLRVARSPRRNLL